VANSIHALTMLFLEFGKNIPVSLMSQYHPVQPQKIEALNRRLTREEFAAVYNHARSLGFINLFVQFPPDYAEDEEDLRFLPDFRKPSPFDA
jgi:putative pyruvate formate lyase activating enzyme